DRAPESSSVAAADRVPSNVRNAPPMPDRGGRTVRRLLPVCLAFLLARPGAAAPTLTEEERVLASARVGAGGPALLEFLRKRSAVKVEREEMQRLVRQLSAADVDADRAQADLIAYGPGALSAL